MHLSVVLLTVCVSAVASLPVELPVLSLDETLGLVNDFVETMNFAGELILDDTHEDVWRRKCEANGGPEAFVLSKLAGFQFAQCVQNIVNVTVLRQEIEESRKTGDMDEVFPKYCDRKNELKDCFSKFVTTSEICLEKKELAHRKILDDIIERIVKFICHKDGNRIALFIAEKGPQCFVKNWQTINGCVKASYTGDFNITLPNSLDAITELPPLPTIKEIPSFTFEKENCLKLNEFQRCAVSALETCDESTPANFVDSVLNHVRKSTPCNEH